MNQFYDPTGGRDAEIADWQRRMELMTYRLEEERDSSRHSDQAQTNNTKAKHDNERTSIN